MVLRLPSPTSQQSLGCGVLLRFRGPRPTSRAHTAVMFTFVLSISVGIAVMLLFSWHLYLVLTAQTTIEFYGNCTLRRRARVRGHDFRNPYHRSYSTNWQHLFGTMRPIIAPCRALVHLQGGRGLASSCGLAW